jgi:hypothetical protein
MRSQLFSANKPTEVKLKQRLVLAVVTQQQAQFFVLTRDLSCRAERRKETGSRGRLSNHASLRASRARCITSPLYCTPDVAFTSPVTTTNASRLGRGQATRRSPCLCPWPPHLLRRVCSRRHHGESGVLSPAGKQNERGGGQGQPSPSARARLFAWHLKLMVHHPPAPLRGRIASQRAACQGRALPRHTFRVSGAQGLRPAAGARPAAAGAPPRRPWCSFPLMADPSFIAQVKHAAMAAWCLLYTAHTPVVSDLSALR